ncbi:MAG TPA: ABC transporter substrate-binding protein [Candidatus Binatia bacterium]
MKAYANGWLVAWALALISHMDGALALAGEPLEIVKSAGERVIAVLKDPKLKAPDKKKERVERLKEIINPIFDYDEMARRTLGAHWRRRTPAEQQEFLKLFRAFLETVYSEKVDLYEGERAVFGRETIDQGYAEVESKVTNSKGEESPVLYRLKRTDGKWKVYDAVVENISIVNNYRSQFDRVLNKSSFEELKKLLREKAA